MRETETSAGHAGEAEGRRRSGPKSPVADQKLRDYYSGLDDFELEVEEEEVAPSYLSAVPEAVMPTAAHTLRRRKLQRDETNGQFNFASFSPITCQQPRSDPSTREPG